MKTSEIKTERLNRRKLRVRHAIKARSGRLRLSVHRTERNIYAQIIDDTAGKTLVSASTLDKDLREKVGKNSANKTGAVVVGTAVAERAVGKGIKEVVFDRSGLRYHGRVKDLADAARKAGLKF